MPTVKTFKGHFSEIYWGDTGLRYSLLKPSGSGYEPYHGNTCCKDFFTDVFYAETLHKDTHIHGFSWKPGMLPANYKTLHMAIEFEGKNLTALAPKAATLVNMWEDRWGIKHTKVVPSDSGMHLIFSFDREWTTRPVMISFLTLLMRLAPAYDGKMEAVEFFQHIIKHGNPYGAYDKGELSKAKVLPMIKHLWETKTQPDVHQTYKQYALATSAHHSGGFIAHTTGEATG